jgi:pimeloyl-ACP methyl ester carboxylesterase
MIYTFPYQKLFLLGALFFWGCASPLASVQPDIDTFLKEYPDNFGTIRSGDKNVQFAWAGDRTKRPLVFVHGSPGSWKGWAHFLLDKNLQNRFYVIAVDRLGYGGSEKGITEASLNLQARAVLDVLNPESKKAILVGHSYGGPVIASAAMQQPERVAGLIFIASSVSPKLEKIKWFQYPAAWWPFKYMIPTELRVCNEEILPLKQELNMQTNQWSAIDSKVVVIQGMDDLLVPPGNADYLVEHLNKSTIVSVEKIPKLGHFVPWQRPDLILKAIDVVEASIEAR